MTTAGDHWQPETYAGSARFVTDLGMPVLALLDPRPGERILDLGCGDGVLTQAIADRGADVVGVDASPQMVVAARALGIDARCVDGTRLTFDAEFDAVFSNAALHWMRPMDAALRGVAAGLRPGGRFVGECGGHGCVAAISIAADAVLRERGFNLSGNYPWEFPTRERFAGMAEAAGFAIEELDHFPRPTLLPGALSDWLEVFLAPVLEAIAPAERADVVSDITALAAPYLRGDDGTWTADYVRLRFVLRRRAG